MSSNRDPVEEYLARISQDPENDPVGQYLARQQQPMTTEAILRLMQDPVPAVSRVGTGILRGMGRAVRTAAEIAQFVGTPEGIFTTIDALRGVPEAQEKVARVGAFSAGMLEGGIAQPLEGALGLPGDILEPALGFELPTSKAADWINRAALGVRTRTEEAALEMGLSEQDIAMAYGVGNFVGFVAPLVASFKMASLALNTGQTLRGQAVAGEFLTDWTAGLIYGGLLTPAEDAESRVKHALRESAIFGAMRVVLMLGVPLREMRNRRALQLDKRGNLRRQLDDLENGRVVRFLDDADVVGDDGILALLQEETYISNSQAALEMFAAREYDIALAQGILDSFGSGATGGIVRKVGTKWSDVSARLERYREALPGMKFDIVRASDGSYTVAFNRRGLSNVQKRQLAQTGRFEGQVAYYGSDQVIYLGEARREGWVKVKDTLTGEAKEVKIDNVSFTPAMSDTSPAPEWDALFRNFREWTESKQSELIQSRGGLTEYDLVQAVRSGEIQLDPQNLRAMNARGALVYPEELGLAGENAIQAVSVAGTSPMGRAAIEAGEELSPEIAEMAMMKGIITRNTRRGHPSDFAAAGSEGLEGPWRFSWMDTQGRPTGHQSYNSLEEAIQFARQQGMNVEDVISKYPSPSELARTVHQTGTEYVNILEPHPAMTFERAYELWAAERGIAQGSADFISQRAYFADRMRRELWQEVPEADRKIFQSIRKEYEERIAELGDDFDVRQLAAVKGFHAETLEDGRTLLRSIDTGISFSFGSERTARDALQRIHIPEGDLPGLFSTGGHGIVDWSRGLPKSGNFRFDEVFTTPDVERNLATHFFRNNRDWLISVEEASRIPVWSKGFDPVSKGYTQMLLSVEPYSREIESAWRGIKIRRRNAIAEQWVKAEGEGWTLNQTVRHMQAEGFSSKEINALRRARAIFDSLYELSGIESSRYIQMYYSRVKPFVDKHGHVDIRRIFGNDLAPAEMEFWAEFTRTGDLAVMEMDPALVMHKYARTLFWQRHVKEPWDELARIVGTKKNPPMRYSDLPADVRRKAMSQALPGTRLDSPVLPEEVRKVLSEYLMTIRGQTAHHTATFREATRKMFNRLGIDSDERVLEELVNSWMSMQYGAAMGVRPMTVARNMTQTMFLLYPRLGAKYMGRGLEMSMTPKGYDEVVAVGVIPFQEAGIPAGDVILENILQRSPQAMNKSNPFSIGLAGGLRSAMRVGRAGRDLSRRSLTWYASSDHASRAWSYWAQKMHTEEWLSRYEAGNISWQKFLDEGLGYFSQPVKKKFGDIYNHVGREEALQNVGRWASDETNFIYGMGAQPPMFQGVLGRLGGMFGTWPMWAIESYMRPLRHATPAQAAKFYARTAIMTGGFVNMGLELGIDIWSWLAPFSIAGWAGGPAVEHIINAKRLIESPMDRKKGASVRLASDMGRLVIPGQVAFNEAMRSSQLLEYSPELAVLNMLIGRPNDLEHIGLEYLYNPESALSEPIMSPETYADTLDDYPSWLDTMTFEKGPPLEGALPADTSDEETSEPSIDELLRLIPGGQDGS